MAAPLWPRKILEKLLTNVKAPKAKVARSPSAYIIFSNKKRVELQLTDPTFSSLTPPEKMSKLGSLWKGLSEADKVPYTAEAAAAKAAMPAPAASDAPEPPAWPLEVTSEKALAALTKALAAEAATALMADLRAGKKIVVPQEGKLVPDKAGVGEDGSLAIKFKPTKKKE